VHLRLVFVLAATLLSLAFPSPAQAKLVLGKLVLHGITKTKDDAIRARMRLQPGDPIDYSVLKAAEERLVASDLFVTVRVWLDVPREEAVRRMYLQEQAEPVDVHVTAEEKVYWFVFPTGSLVIRTDVNPLGLARAAREVVRSVDPRQPVEKLMELDAIRDESVGPRRINAMLIGSFSLLALVIAAIGIAAVLAFSVSARTNEIGIRMSLGADSGMVQRMVLAEGGVLLIAGLVVGVAGAILTTRLIQGLLFGVTPHDPVTIVSVSALMAAIGVAACWIPARRAARIDPATAMRGKR